MPDHKLIYSQNGNCIFKISDFNDGSGFDHFQRVNNYTILIITKGKGKLKADFAEYSFSEKSILFFSPYQPFMLYEEDLIQGTVVNFHPDFFCIHKHQKEVACNGVLFNNIYQTPVLQMNQQEIRLFLDNIEQMKVELHKPELAQYELLVSYLKIFLIQASRIKVSQNWYNTTDKILLQKEPFIVDDLKNAIELHYKSKHSPSEYSSMFNISPKSLNKITKTHFNKTLTKLISERIIIEAKRELYLTSKTVKEIAYTLGFNDEYYFSRFFKTNTEISPQLYRDTVGFAKADT